MKTRKRLVATAIVVALTLTLGGIALAAKPSTQLKATLNIGQEVPKPLVKATGGTGTFTGTLIGSKLTWTLTFQKLTGPASAAHIHLARPGKAGPVAVPLCGPCTSGASGTATLSAAQVAAVVGGGAYVNVHTAKNPNGEIRGQITQAAAGKKRY